jgi:hypothetical protein
VVKIISGLYSKQFQHFEPGKFGHLHVKENQVGFLLVDGFQPVETVFALANQFNVVESAEM